MKAERRHELQENDLARKIIQAPDYFKLYGGRIALAIVVLAAAAMLVNYRLRANRENAAAAQAAVTAARSAVSQLGAMNMTMAGRGEDEIAQRRQQLQSGAVQAIDTVNERSEDPKLLAQAQALKGDLYWHVANLIPLPGATTRPALAVEPKAEDALLQAEAAYKRVVESYSDQVQQVAVARFGLAAIAENRGQWDEARKQYEALKGNEQVAAVYKDIVEGRLRMLGQMQKGIYVAVGAAATTQPGASTGPAGAGSGPSSTSAAPATTQAVQ